MVNKKKSSVRQQWGVFAALLLAGSMSLSSCSSNNDNNTPQLQTINDLVIAGDRFTLLEAAVARAGLGATLGQTGPFTVFAPSDDAFRAAGYADVAAINAAPDTTLRRILQYHVISGTAIPSSAIVAGQTAQPSSLSTNGTLYITRATSTSGSSAISVNNARVIAADGQASNGVIHAIDRVLMPPRGNILQVAQADTSLSLLVAAAIQGGTAVTSALGGTTPLTVFAPTNAAFRATPYNTVAAIQAANPAALASVLTNHVVANARAYSPTVVSGPITTFGGGSVTATVGSNNAITLLSRGNGTTAATVTTADINATNGVIHKIDRVLLP